MRRCITAARDSKAGGGARGFRGGVGSCGDIQTALPQSAQRLWRLRRSRHSVCNTLATRGLGSSRHRLRARVVQHSGRFSRLCFVGPEEEITAFGLRELTGIEPAPVVLAAVFGLELLRWEARRAVAVPDSVGEEAFEGDFLGGGGGGVAAAFFTSVVGVFEHGGVSLGCG